IALSESGRSSSWLSKTNRCTAHTHGPTLRAQTRWQNHGGILGAQAGRVFRAGTQHGKSPAGSADDFFCNFEVSSLQAHGAKRILVVHALLQLFFSCHIEEAAQLFVQLPLHTFLSEQ